jgi:hypothetical protein
MKLSVVSIALILLFQTGCSLNLKTFGSKTLSSELPSTSVKGNFPLGEPEFSGYQKYSLSVTPSNQIVFVDNFNVIRVLSSAGKSVRSFSIPSTYSVDTLTTDGSGNILVTGKYAVNGDAFLMKYSITGQSLGELVHFPAYDTGGGVYGSVLTSYLKVSTDGSIFMRVQTNGNHRIEKYSPTGTLLQTYANTGGTGDGQFNGVENFFPNADGTLYVTDQMTNRIQLLNANGSFNSKFTWPKQEAASFIYGLLRNNDGTFVLVENGNAHTYLHKFDAAGTALWMKDGTEAGAAYSWYTPSLAKNSNQYSLTIGDVLYVYSETGGLLNVYKKPMSRPTAVTRSKDGSFFIADDNGIFKYNAAGSFLNTFGPAEMNRVMAVGSNNILYVGSVTNGAEIKKYNLDGVLQGTITIGAGSTSGICVDKNNNVFVSADTTIYKIAASNEAVTVFKSGTYTGMSCNDDGTIFALFYNGSASVVQKLSSTGTVLQTFDHSGAAAVGAVYGLTVSPQGFLVLPDTYTSNKIFVFKTDGTFVRSFGNTGPDALNAPFGVFADTYGNIFVADTDNHFVRKFSITGTLLTE